MTIEIKGLDKLNKSLSAMSKQIPFATAMTLNDLAFDSMKALNADLKQTLKTRVNTSKGFCSRQSKEDKPCGSCANEKRLALLST